MTPNNNLSVLPFYTDLKYQNGNKPYAFGEIYALMTLRNWIIPFQIIRDTNADTTIDSVILKTEDGDTVKDITADLKNGGLTISRHAELGFDVIIYPASNPLSEKIDQGIYYLELTDGIGDTWYSDLFTAKNSVSNAIKIEWWDAEDLFFTGGCIDYSNGYRNIVYICSDLGRPEYEFEEEGEERDGYFFPEKQISEKTYRFTFLAPEYLCDAMRVIRMSDYVRITYMDQVYDCDTFEMEVEWLNPAFYAAVEAEFQCDTVIKKIGRGYSSLPTENTYDYELEADINPIPASGGTSTLTGTLKTYNMEGELISTKEVTPNLTGSASGFIVNGNKVSAQNRGDVVGDELEIDVSSTIDTEDYGD